MGEPDKAPGSWLQTRPAVAVVAILESEPEDRISVPPLFVTAFQRRILKRKGHCWHRHKNSVITEGNKHTSPCTHCMFSAPVRHGDESWFPCLRTPKLKQLGEHTMHKLHALLASFSWRYYSDPVKLSCCKHRAWGTWAAVNQLTTTNTTLLQMSSGLPRSSLLLRPKLLVYFLSL